MVIHIETIIKKISIRNLVEFILRSGDIESGSSGFRDVNVMQEGIKIHKYLQKKGGPNYVAEVSMYFEKDFLYDDYPLIIKLEGRADGIIENDDEIIVNEIKSMYADVMKIDKAYDQHLAQAKCYAAIYCNQNEIDKITIRMSYCQIETMQLNELDYHFTRDEIIEWLDELIYKYAKWVVWEYKWKKTRNRSIKNLKFPFEYRDGQFELIKNIYFTIIRNKNIFVQAPTGVGKTISTVFPSVMGMGEDVVSKVFYLTAKTITRTVAEEAFNLLINKGLKYKVITITAKEKICVLDKPDCNPVVCERAKGHYDRINDAVYDMLTHEEIISRGIIEEYAEKYSVCPFEMCLDVSLWCDGIICDYNYVFDPTTYLKRYFGENINEDYVFLIDEAHNLVERARQMYTADIDKSLVMDVKAQVKNYSRKLYKALDSLNSSLLQYKRICDDFLVLESVGDIVLKLMRVMTAYEEFLKDILPKNPEFGDTEELMQLYFDARFFLSIYDVIDEKYRIYADYGEKQNFRITLACMDPSTNLKEYLKKGRAAVFFSATFLPVKYYMEQLGGKNDDYAVYAKSSFNPDKQLILVARDVSARYTRRNAAEYEKIAKYIDSFASAKNGNYLVFFPSYKVLEDVYEHMNRDNYVEYVIQHKNMTEEDKEEFLAHFEEASCKIRIGLCVMGGVFGEGIDLREDRLIGVAIVGTGLPMVGDVRQLYKDYFDEVNGRGFDYSYLYPGMNKVLQAAGRVIRTDADKGAILLLDDRFTGNSYSALFPREWKNIEYVNINNVCDSLKRFWDRI